MEFINICRACLAEKLELFSIFDDLDSNLKYSEVLQQISQLEIDQNDILSKNICSTCKYFCQEFVKFRESLVASHEYQISLVCTEVPKTEDYVEIENNLSIEENENYSLVEIDDIAPNQEEFQMEELIPDYMIMSASSEGEDQEFDDEEYANEYSDDNEKSDSKSYSEEKPRKRKSRGYECPKCHRKFSSAIMLMRHEIVHSDLIKQIKTRNPNQCIVCMTDFSSKGDLETHFREHKEFIEKDTISCIHCSKEYVKFGAFLKHLNTHEENKVN
jgi:Zinc-finger associated domain (zf-AD)